ncbi:MAG: DegV family protein, partial [Clostridia bacterium]|nr:DegV family protein [Clostridia bacterium]
MRNFVLSACSTMDLNLEQVKERDIKFLNFKYYIDGEEHIDDMFETTTPREFYDKVAGGAETKTSQIN